MFYALISLLIACVTLSAAESPCTGAVLKGSIKSAVDSTVSQHTSVVADLELTCKSGVPASFPLYGEVNGKFFAAARSQEDPRKYQISICDETVNFLTSAVSLKIFDEDGYQLARKGGNTGKPLAVLDHSIRYSHFIKKPSLFYRSIKKSEQ